MQRLLIAVLLCLVPVGASAQVAPEAAEPSKIAAPVPEPIERPVIQIAILLDTSGSMTGLINQARTQLWKIVNELATTRRNGLQPQLEVALYHYGTPSLGSRTGYIKQLLPLTRDLDAVSEKLFALTTNGGDEYCGHVIQTATNELKWSSSPDIYRAIFIAGNEPFTQGSVNYRKACKAAIARGIIVNTIHCGDEAAGIDGKWKDGALLADGSYMCIDQNQKIVHIPAPQDHQIAELGVKLNATYIAYGAAGEASFARQARQDANAATASPSAAVQRAVTKSQGLYENAGWDLVDAMEEKDFDLSKVADKDLPENMRSMTPAQRTEHIATLAARRADLQKQINQLNAARQTFVAQKRKEMAAETGAKTLDEALLSAIRHQAAQRGYETQPTEPTPDNEN